MNIGYLPPLEFWFVVTIFIIGLVTTCYFIRQIALYIEKKIP